jgi:large subunit ribosomal protein L2
MGKRIIQQARGKGSHTYRVRKKAFIYRMKYPRELEGEGEVLKLMNSAAHSYPIAKVKSTQGIFYIPAFKQMVEGQKISFGGEVKNGNILALKDLPVKTKIYNIESRPGDGGRFVRSGGSSATVNKIVGDSVFVLMPSKKEKKFNNRCRATVGIIAGAGRLEKPMVKAGRKFHLKKSKSKLWPRTSAVKMNPIDHPFGSGRGKHPKPKIAKRNAPPGRKVGHVRPKRTGKKR